MQSEIHREKEYWKEIEQNSDNGKSLGNGLISNFYFLVFAYLHLLHALQQPFHSSFQKNKTYLWC